MPNRIENPSPETLRKRRWRAAQKAKAEAVEAGADNGNRGLAAPESGPWATSSPTGPTLPVPPKDPARAVVEWAESALVVPSGLLARQPFIVPPWQREFLYEALAPTVGQAGLSVARKNGKSGLVAVLLLAHLAGPLLRQGWRGAVVSLTAMHARELRDAMSELIEASGLRHLDIRVSPHPGRIHGPFSSRVDFLSADKASGHAIGVDLAVIDEAGLMGEDMRPLWNALLTSTSGRDGRLVAISIRGTGPMFREMKTLHERHPKDAAWIEHAAPENASLDDEEAWAAGNPGLASGIKSIDYMRRQAARAKVSPSNAVAFRAYDLNIPGSPDYQTIVPVHEWKQTLTTAEVKCDRRGPCFVGIDLGSSDSMSAAVVYWLDVGILETFVAWPRKPSLEERGLADGVGQLYAQWWRDGWLSLHGNRVTDNGEFLGEVFQHLQHEQLMAVGHDKYQELEVSDALKDIPRPYQCLRSVRGSSLGASAEGNADITAFRRYFLRERIVHDGNPIAAHAIDSAQLIRDGSDNYRIEKVGPHSRIDWLSAAVIACGMARQWEVNTGRAREDS